MNRMSGIFMLSCRKATELMEKKQHAGLSLMEKLKLKVHAKVCNGCREYSSQSKLMEKALQREGDTLPDTADTDALRSRILQRLKDD